MNPTFRRIQVLIGMSMLSGVALTLAVFAAPRTAPEGLFKNHYDAVVGDAKIISGKQLFIDDDWI